MLDFCGRSAPVGRDPGPATAAERELESITFSRGSAPPGNTAPCGFDICGLNLQPQGAASYREVNGKCVCLPTID